MPALPGRGPGPGLGVRRRSGQGGRVATRDTPEISAYCRSCACGSACQEGWSTMRITGISTAVLATAVIVGGVPAAQAAQPVDTPKPPRFSATIKEGRAAVRSALKQTKATSASIALVSKGKIVWSQTFGRVTPAGKKPSSNDDVRDRIGEQDGHRDRGDAVGGRREGVAGRPGGALHPGLQDGLAAVPADHRADAAQPLRGTPRHGLLRRVELHADPRLRRAVCCPACARRG